MKTSCVFSLCLHYTHFDAVYNGQKKLRDEIFITEHKSVKIFIKSAEMIKLQRKTGKSRRHRAFNQLCKPLHNKLRILAHIISDPVEHKPYKHV